MYRSLRGLWLALPLTVGLITDGRSQNAPTADVASIPSLAADTDDQLEEVVITAQRRPELAQDVPISISVASGQALQDAGFHDLTDIQHIDPAVQYDPNNGGSFQIRGVGTQAWDFSTEQSVSVVVDDVVQDLPREPGLTSLTDIERIEVLRGPQGIQFGQNATAGVISVITKRPRLGELSGDLTAEYGEREDEKFQGNLNAPFGDAGAVRISGYYQGQNGLGRYTVLGENLGKYEEYGTRAKLLVQPTETLNFLLTGDVDVHHDDNCYTLLSAVNPFAAFAAAAGVTVGPHNVDSASAAECVLDYRTEGASLVGNLDVGSSTLTSVSAYEDLTYTQAAPIESDPVTRVFAPINNNDIDAHKLSEELRLTSPSGGLLTYVAGLYVNRLVTGAASEQALMIPGLPPGFLAANTNAAGVPSPGLLLDDAVAESEAAFATVTIRPARRLELVLGGRLTHDLSSQGVAYESIATGYQAIGTGPTPNPPRGSRSATNFSYRVAPTLKLVDNAIAFVTYSTGYKAPGVAYVGAVYSPFRRETVGDFEVGVKSELLDRKLRLNADVFREEFKNFQAQDQQGIYFVVLNAGGLRSEGAELELEWQASHLLTLHTSVSYADAVFTDFLYTNNGVTAQLAGQPLTSAPKWATTAGATFSTPVAPDLELDATVDYAWRGTTYLHLDDPGSEEGSYGLLQARLGFGPPNGRWRAGVYGRNLTNSYYIDLSSYLPFGYRIAQTDNNAGRTVGGFVNMRF